MKAVWIPNMKWRISPKINKVTKQIKKLGKEINQAYKKMELGWLAYNPYRINVGSIGIRQQEHKNE